MTTITTETGETFFLIDPRHEDFVRENGLSLKDRRLTWPQRMILLGLVILSGWLLAGQLLADSIRSEATILEKAEGPDIGTYYVTYSFLAEVLEGRETVTIEEQIDYAIYEQLEIGDRRTVQYRPNNFEDARIIERTPDAINANNLLLFLTLILIGMAVYIFIFWIIRPDARNRFLESEGVLIRGKITNIYPRKLPRRYIVTVNFEFPLPDETTQTGETSHNRRDLETTVLPRPGTKLLVLYVNEQAFRLM